MYTAVFFSRLLILVCTNLILLLYTETAFVCYQKSKKIPWIRSYFLLLLKALVGFCSSLLRKYLIWRTYMYSIELGIAGSLAFSSQSANLRPCQIASWLVMLGELAASICRSYVSPSAVFFLKSRGWSSNPECGGVEVVCCWWAGAGEL